MSAAPTSSLQSSRRVSFIAGLAVFSVHTLTTLFIPIYLVLSFSAAGADTYSSTMGNLTWLQYPARWLWSLGLPSRGSIGLTISLLGSMAWGCLAAVLVRLGHRLRDSLSIG